MKVIPTLLALFFLFLSVPSFAEVKGKTVEYTYEGTTLKGYLAYDDSIKGKRPGVLVVHEWWGLNDYAKKRADMLAGLGYTALALDMFGNGKTADHPSDAQKFTSETMSNMAVAEGRFDAALDFLKKQPTVNPDEIAAIGYCFGGGIVLHMARTGADLDGVASFHGSLGTQQKAAPGTIKAKILVMTGGADTYIPAEQVEEFKKEMDAAGADYEVIVYPGATHSFTNPAADELGKKFDLPITYNAEADKQSWAEMEEFLKKVFNQEQNGN